MNRVVFAAAIWAGVLLSGCGQKAAETSLAADAARAAESAVNASGSAAGANEAAGIDETASAEERANESAGAYNAGAWEVTDYADSGSWAYLETEKDGAEADVFFICPSVYQGSDPVYNMPLSDEDAKESFVGAINMEKGIYDEDSRFFAPYYQQIGLSVYEMPEAEREPYLELAYRDIAAAFDYYYETYNNGRPIILAGFSQGADMCIRLMKDCFDEEKLMNQLVACYAIGWRVTEEDVEACPQLQMAQGETDTGVIVSFNSEAVDVTDSLLIPRGTRTFAINPLNWKTDGTPADRSLNKGACFTDYSGEIVREIPQLTGAYLDETRGALKVPDVSPKDYPGGLSIFEDGVYHLYDYQFFYRNLQENVEDRLEAFLDA